MPYDRSRYPADWPVISRAIRERDGNRCKTCGVANGAYRLTYPDGHEEVTRDELAVEAAVTCDDARVARIVLTVAHLHDPDPMNCDDANLAALCQRDHNRLDAKMRAANAASTRRRKRAAVQPELMEA